MTSGTHRLEITESLIRGDIHGYIARLLRCDRMQGYVFSKPLPLEDVAATLAKAKA